MLETIKVTANYIRNVVEKLPDTAIILGTGLGELVNHINIVKETTTILVRKNEKNENSCKNYG